MVVGIAWAYSGRASAVLVRERPAGSSATSQSLTHPLPHAVPELARGKNPDLWFIACPALCQTSGSTRAWSSNNTVNWSVRDSTLRDTIPSKLFPAAPASAQTPLHPGPPKPDRVSPGRAGLPQRRAGHHSHPAHVRRIPRLYVLTD